MNFPSQLYDLLEDLTETITLISAEIIRKFDFNVTLSSNN